MRFMENLDLKEMPDVVISELADADRISYEKVALPHQSLLSLNPMLGKPAGGARTICKTPTLYRVSNIVSGKVQSWEANISHSCPFDRAKKGSSALDAALAQGLEAEVAFWLGQHFCFALNDFHNLFDAILAVGRY